MKTTITSILLLTAAAGTLASPAARRGNFKRQDQFAGQCILDTVDNNPSDADLQAAIKQWTNDVLTVNDFLNNAASFIDQPDQLLKEATTALFQANDEPCQLKTLAANIDFKDLTSGPVLCAINDLKRVFDDQVLRNLQIIVDNPSDVDAINTAVEKVNLARCCDVLPSLDLLWTGTETDGGFFGLDGILGQPPRPDACLNGSIQCNPICVGL